MPSSDRPTPLARSALAAGLLLVAVVAWTYAPVRHFAFVRWDDDINFTQNPLLTEPWSLALLKQLFTADQALRFEPVHWLCCRLLHSVAGFDPAIWHMLGLFWHLLAATLFAHVLRRLFLRFQPGAQSRGMLIAILAAAAWAVHPLRVETVAWATASTYPLTGVCLLASFACYLRTIEPGRRHRAWLGLAWGLAVLGYGSYPVGATYSLWLVIFDFWLLRQGLSPSGPENLRWWIKHSLFVLPAAIAVGITIWTRYADPGIFTAAPDLATVGLPTRLAVALAGITALAWGFVWPMELSPNRLPLNLASTGPLVLVIIAAVIAGLTLVVAWRGRRARPGLALVIAGFAALSIPCLGLTERPTWPVDRYSYLVHLILTGGVAAWLFRRPQPGLRMLAVTGVMLIAGESFAARVQMRIWRDSDSLFTHMAQEPRFADNPRQQGHVYILWARYLATNRSPERAAAMFNRAQSIYLEAIKAAVAKRDYAEALSLSTHIEHHFALTPVMHRERGAWLLRLGRPTEALVELRRAQADLPDDPRVTELIGEAHRPQ